MTLNRIELDAQTGEVAIIDLKGDELTAYNEYVSASEAEVAGRTEAEAKAETDKAELLAKLGITADEAKLLLS